MTLVPVPTGRPIVFYAPHPDDEVLFAGHIIAHHALVGREVHVVAVCDGGGSSALAHLNGTGVNAWWGRQHQPDVEGYEPLLREDMVAARRREFVSSCGALGVRPENVHLEGIPDGGTTLGNTGEIFQKYRGLFPTAGHYTTSWLDVAEHRTLGLELRYLAEGSPGDWPDVRWFLKRELAASAPSNLGLGRYVVPSAYAKDTLQMTRNATNAYRSWAPSAGMFAFGYHSVGLGYFRDVEDGQLNYVHRLPS